MIRARWGRVINISSVVGLMGNPGQVNYASSKAALIGFTKALALEIGSRNITVNAIAPGYISDRHDRRPPRRSPRKTRPSASPSNASAPPTTSPTPSCSWPANRPATSPGRC